MKISFFSKCGPEVVILTKTLSIEDFQIFGRAWYGSHGSPGQYRILPVTEPYSLPPSTTCKGFGTNVLFPAPSFSGLPAMKLANDIERVIGSTKHDLDISAIWDNKQANRGMCSSRLFP